jgi:peptidoglycan/xylan/chitin deacetylase (PgdA/CDA1 family)
MAARRRRRTLGLVRLGVALALVGGLVFGAITLLKKVGAPSLEASGPPANAQIGPAQLASLRFTAKGAPSDLARQHWTLDGTRVVPRVGGAGSLVFKPARLRDGEHRFAIVATGGLLGSKTTRSWAFTVDTKAPELRLDRPAVGYASKPVQVSGSANEAAVLRADGRRVELNDGRFTLRYETPPARPVILTATDAVGNTSRWRMPVTLVPRLPREPVRAVHVSADGWASSPLRQGVLEMIDQHRINTVELDLKDEAGVVGWDAPVPLARKYGAVRDTYDLKSAVEMLHAKGVRVIGRLVAFRDPIFAAAAWKDGKRDEVIQTPDGGPYAGYGGFSNFADRVVRRYNIDIAVAAAKVGVDEILYDYVRRPDGPTSSMVFPGIRETPERSIASFLGQTRKALRPYGPFLGASVFGIASTRPEEVAQNIPMIARQVDYVSPMVYPSHWAPGEFDVASPESQPYDIVKASVDDFAKKVKGTGARVVPWLQDFSLAVDYGPTEVAAQVKAAKDAGVDEFLLWDPLVTYDADGLARNAEMPSVGTAPTTKLPANAPGLIRIGGTTIAGTASASTAGGPVAGAPNELGLVPVLMHHRIVDGRDSEYDLTPAEFRAELQRLWKDAYVPITAAEYVSGKIDLPTGKRPVVMTFDDGSETQFGLTADGEVEPDTAVGIMLAFAKGHPGFRAAGTFYVNRDPFGAGSDAPRLLNWLAQNGFEIGNHTTDHVNLESAGSDETQKQLADEAAIVEDAVPGYKIKTMALPFGVKPADASLAVRGSSGGRSYGPYAVMLVGANPAPSPFASDFDAANIPRIRSSQKPWTGAQDYAFSYWFDQLEDDPGSVYVSDGDPAKVTFPESEAGDLAARYQSKANPS